MAGQQQTKLRELENNIKVVGTLKEVNLDIKPNKKDPSIQQIMGNVVVTVVEDNKINEHTLNLFAKHTSKLFKGYKTIKDTYKASDDVGAENADRVSCVGSVDENIYAGQDGQLRQFNRNRGLFINRVDEKALQRDPSLAEDSATAQLEVVVTGIRDKADKEGVETGEIIVDGFTVGYNDSVHKIRDMVVGTDLADVISENYDEGATGKLTFKMNNYAEVDEKDEEPNVLDEQEGFGHNPDISNGPVVNYVRELRLIGGFPPYVDERALEEDDIALAKRIHALKVQEAQNGAPATPPNHNQKAQNGFGSNASQGNGDPFADQGEPIDISDDDLPF